MPRIRTIKPDFFKSEDVSALPLRARLTWIGLWTQCDDHGRYKDSARLIKGDVWPLDDVSLRDIEEDLAALAAARRIVRYEVEGKHCLAVVNWHGHQAINRPSRAKHPAPPEALGSPRSDDLHHCPTGECVKPNPHASLREPSLNGHLRSSGVSAGQPTHGALTEPSVSAHGGLTPGKERKGREGRGRARPRDTGPSPPPDPGPEPPRNCPKHRTQPADGPCGACADTRRTHDQWQLDHSAWRLGAPRCRHHQGQPAHNCALCRSEQLAAKETA